MSYCFIILGDGPHLLDPDGHILVPGQERGRAYPRCALPHEPPRKAGRCCLNFGQPVKTDPIKREKENRHWGTTSSLSSIFLENRAFQKREWAGQGGRNHYLIQGMTSGFQYLSHHQKGCGPLLFLLRGNSSLSQELFLRGTLAQLLTHPRSANPKAPLGHGKDHK